MGYLMTDTIVGKFFYVISDIEKPLHEKPELPDRQKGSIRGTGFVERRREV
jgi:hypothetical protein